MKYALLKNLHVQPVSKLNMHSLTVTLIDGTTLSLNDILNVERKRMIDVYLKIKLHSIIKELEFLILNINHNTNPLDIFNAINKHRSIFDFKNEREYLKDSFEYFNHLFKAIDFFCECYFLSKKSKSEFINEWKNYSQEILNKNYIDFNFKFGIQYNIKKMILKNKMLK